MAGGVWEQKGSPLHTHTHIHTSAGKLVFAESSPLFEAVFGVHLSRIELIRKSCGVYMGPMAGQDWT